MPGTPPASRIASRDKPQARELLKRASSARSRRESGLALLEGAHLVSELLAHRRRAALLCASDSGLRHEEVRRLFEECPADERLVLSDRAFGAVSSVATPTGLLAVIALPPRSGFPDHVENAVVLENVQDTGNVGTILRTTAAAGLRTVISCGATAFFWSPKVLRAAMGAHFMLDLHESASADEVLKAARSPLIATACASGDSIYALDLVPECVWLFGNEGVGLTSRLLQAADMVARIPTASGIESLNVAAAAAVCLFEQMRQRSVALNKPVARA